MNPIRLVCEIGINHQGDLNIAKRLMEMAAGVGAYCVKFQRREIEVSTPKDVWDTIRTWQGEQIRYIDYRAKVEFSREQYDEIDSYSRELGINWTASVWDLESVDFMQSYDVPFLKIPSAKLNHTELLQHSLSFPLIVSTGMSTLKEIADAVSIIEVVEGNQLMHCHSAYPAPDEELSLPLIPKLKEWFGLPVGYSSHSKSYYPALFAAVLGASIIEAHITLDRTMEGSDHAASLEKRGLENLARELERIPQTMSNSEKIVWPSELPARKKLRGY